MFDNSYAIFFYFLICLFVTCFVLLLSVLKPVNKSSLVKFMPYESGMQTKTQLLQKRFLLAHGLIALLFLVLDVEVVFLYPWAIVGKEIGKFAFYEMAFFLLVLGVGFIYIWRKGGLQWGESKESK